MRLMCLAGYEPSLDACAVCGDESENNPFFDISGGVLLCGSCAGGDAFRLCDSSLAALRHVTSCQAQRILSFRLSGEALNRFCYVCEQYVTHHLERHFHILDYLNNLE